jgi:hypothetical protein
MSKNKKTNDKNKNDKNVRGFSDLFYHTQFTATTVTKIKEVYEEVKNKLPCRSCNVNCVETKIEVQDTHHPTFVIARKHTCSSCWLQSVKLRHYATYTINRP